MRIILAGLITLLITATQSLGQIKAEVESVGFQNVYRPDCWTPMVIRINPQGAATGQYEIRVKQRDLDGDDVIFTKDISLTGGEGSRDQRYWMYFIPQPRGLPDSTDGSTLRDLQKELRVYLYTKAGKEVMTIPITSTVTNVDPKPGALDRRLGRRVILVVSDGKSQIVWNEYDQALGLLEAPVFIQVRPDQLPENPIGYESIDGLVWLNVDPAELTRRGPEQMNAVRSYVKSGGQLVICHPAEWQKTLAFGDMLPVDPIGVRTRDDLQPLRSIAGSRGESKDPEGKTIADPWLKVPGPYTLVAARVQPNSVVDQWISWDDKGTDRSPYIARKVFGCGGVTWVAQDLGDPSITSRTKVGWTKIWDKVFDWKNDPTFVDPKEKNADERKFPYSPGPGVDFGPSYLGDMAFDKKVGIFIGLAVLFFIGYWAIAGPGTFVALLRWKKTQQSWFIFAASAIVATLLTVVIVKLVLRGPAEVKQLSLVRGTVNQPTNVISRFGLYIPRDGAQVLELKNASPDSVSTITAFPSHPAHQRDNAESLSAQDYLVPVRESASEEAPAITVPYRSSLKKFAVNWTGDLPNSITGSVKVDDSDSRVTGRLTNNTGKNLRNVYLAVKLLDSARSDSTGIWRDYVLFMPKWDAGVTIDLAKDFFGLPGSRTPLIFADGPTRITPENDKRIVGYVINSDSEWMRYWTGEIKRVGNSLTSEGIYDDNAARIPRSFPMLSLFQRLPVIKNNRNATESLSGDRVELVRRGVRKWDLSPAMAAGGMIVLGQADNQPLAVPITVEGDPITGTGRELYQFVIPVDRAFENGAEATPASVEK